MSLNRVRNIYTLGDFQKGYKRRQPADPFERDPFKIQSYNFRYADRPNLQPKVDNNQKILKGCQTYFYNHDFDSANKSYVPRNTARNLVNDEGVLNLSKFQESRRQKFLHECGPKRTETMENSLSYKEKAYDSKILNLYYGNRNVKTSTGDATPNQNCYKPRHSSHALDGRYSKPQPLKTLSTHKPRSGVHQSLSTTPRGIYADHKRSLSSGCEININIKSLERCSQQENVNIKIETDSLYRNLNIPWRTTSNISGQVKGRVEHLNSSATFVIDKRLSKFATNQDKISDIINKPRDRVKELTSIYSTQMLKKSATTRPIKCADRLPSLIPFKTRDATPIKSSSMFSKENLYSNKSLLTRSRNNFSAYDNKVASKGCSFNNNLYPSPLIPVNGAPKPLNTTSWANKSTYMKQLNNARQSAPITSKHSLSSAANIYDFKSTTPLRLRSSAKLPLNVNINVFADKLKLLKV